MNSVANSTASTETSTGKLPVIKLANADHSKTTTADSISGNSDKVDVGDSAKASVVIIKECCDDEAGSGIQNGGLPVKCSTMSAEGAAKVENGAMDSLEAGVGKVAINGTNQNRMVRVSQ